MKIFFNDGSHILYVNGNYRGDGEIGKLMHDFSCANPDDMNYDALAKRARYFKQDEKGVAAMSKILEDMRNEAAKEAAQKAEQDKAKKTAVRLIKLGKMTLEEIAEATELSLDIVKELGTQSMQLA